MHAEKTQTSNCFDSTSDLLEEFPPTDNITVLMDAVLNNHIKAVSRLLSIGGIIWNQRGPCGRKPEQVALDLGHTEIHSMLLAIREQAELAAELATSIRAAQRRL